MRETEPVFVDTSAWIALAVTGDPHHSQALELWEQLLKSGARLNTSIPVVLETFTFLDRETRRNVAIDWKDSLAEVPHFRIVPVVPHDLERAWPYFQRRDLHKLSAVDATSFVIMSRENIRSAFTFDYHFVMAGFQLLS